MLLTADRVCGVLSANAPSPRCARRVTLLLNYAVDVLTRTEHQDILLSPLHWVSSVVQTHIIALSYLSVIGYSYLAVFGLIFWSTLPAVM